MACKYSRLTDDEVRKRLAANGEAELVLAGRAFRVRREFLDDLARQRLDERVARLRKVLLVSHAPSDDNLGIEHANRIFTAAQHPKSSISQSDADHLLSRKSDAAYVGNVIAAWADRCSTISSRSNLRRSR